MTSVRFRVGTLRALVGGVQRLMEAGEGEDDPWSEKTDPDPEQGHKAEKAEKEGQRQKRQAKLTEPSEFGAAISGGSPEDPEMHRRVLDVIRRARANRPDVSAQASDDPGTAADKPKLELPQSTTGGRTPRMDVSPPPSKDIAVKGKEGEEPKRIRVYEPTAPSKPKVGLHPRERGVLGPRPERSDEPGLDVMLPPSQRTRGLVPLASLDDLWAQDERAYEALMKLPEEYVEKGRAFSQGGFLMFRPGDPKEQTKIWAAKRVRKKIDDPDNPGKKKVIFFNEPHAWRTYSDLNIDQKRDIGWLEPRDREGPTPVKATGKEREPVEYTTLWDPEANIMGSVPGATSYVPGRGGGIPSQAAVQASRQARRAEKQGPVDISTLPMGELQSMLRSAISTAKGSGSSEAKRRVATLRDEIRKRLSSTGPKGKR